MRKVKFRRFIPANNLQEYGDFEEEFGGEGLFHQWGTESNNIGVAYTFAIVELPDGTVIKVYADQIKFITPPEPVQRKKRIADFQYKDELEGFVNSPDIEVIDVKLTIFEPNPIFQTGFMGLVYYYDKTEETP